MHVSYPPNPLPGEAYRVALEDWDLLFEAVMTRLRDTVVRDANGHALSPMLQECLDTLEQLRELHPSVLGYVR
ncbi:hypothetical protein [Rhodoferax sp.]|uniref:hypothetical protein n=1 Tax=Rhodoferax sp. TaxID=50421 RepID=UPI0025F8F133|nr:hypothetical protein [Rhodoferax sp.]